MGPRVEHKELETTTHNDKDRGLALKDVIREDCHGLPRVGMVSEYYSRGEGQTASDSRSAELYHTLYHYIYIYIYTCHSGREILWPACAYTYAKPSDTHSCARGICPFFSPSRIYIPLLWEGADSIGKLGARGEGKGAHSIIYAHLSEFSDSWKKSKNSLSRFLCLSHPI